MFIGIFGPRLLPRELGVRLPDVGVRLPDEWGELAPPKSLRPCSAMELERMMLCATFFIFHDQPASQPFHVFLF